MAKITRTLFPYAFSTVAFAITFATVVPHAAALPEVASDEDMPPPVAPTDASQAAKVEGLLLGLFLFTFLVLAIFLIWAWFCRHREESQIYDETFLGCEKDEHVHKKMEQNLIQKLRNAYLVTPRGRRTVTPEVVVIPRPDVTKESASFPVNTSPNQMSAYPLSGIKVSQDIVMQRV